MGNYCGQCRHFVRAKENLKDQCGAWDQPTLAKRDACGFFMPKKPNRNSLKGSDTRE